MKWEMIVEFHWPKHLIEGEYPNRGTRAVEEERQFQLRLAEGWEPFAVLQLNEATKVWMKRQQ